jgi:1,4-dihydroxy-6-naphthoate synthase
MDKQHRKGATVQRILKIGYSTCPNDTYIFAGLAEGRIDIAPYRLETVLADVEELNRKAVQGELDVTKLSYHAASGLLDDYVLLRSGGALGRGCGPIVVARKGADMPALREASIAIPGRKTTAHLLLDLYGGHCGPRPEMRFDLIMPAVARGDVDAGLLIHEGRFTYGIYGLTQVLDLGDWWERETGAPIPLGCIAARRDLGPEIVRFVDGKIRESLEFARANPAAVEAYIESFAQEMEPDVISRHIDTFVNEYSLDVGPEGERAAKLLLDAARRASGLELPDFPVFRKP